MSRIKLQGIEQNIFLTRVLYYVKSLENGLTVGDRVIVSSGFGSRPGILRYLGETQFASGNWCGIELDEDSGKNDGSVEGVRFVFKLN